VAHPEQKALPQGGISLGSRAGFLVAHSPISLVLAL
jgi:hypothetical protein